MFLFIAMLRINRLVSRQPLPRLRLNDRKSLPPSASGPAVALARKAVILASLGGRAIFVLLADRVGDTECMPAASSGPAMQLTE